MYVGVLLVQFQPYTDTIGTGFNCVVKSLRFRVLKANCIFNFSGFEGKLHF